MIGIYKITSPSGKVYIGQSIDIERRFDTYRKYDNQYKSQKKLYNSFQKYGIDNHIFEIIIKCDEKQLNVKERYYQELYNVIGKNGLNCRLTKTNDRSGKLSEETKMLISKANKGKTISEEHKQRVSESQKGRKPSLETLQKRSKSLKGKITSSETKLKMSISAIGKRMSDKSRKKMSNNSHMRRKVICININKIWNSIKECSEDLNLDYRKLRRQLCGEVKNKTSIRYYNK